MENREKEVPFFWMEESNEQLSAPVKWKRKVRTKKMEFIEWGSKPLIEFLESIGKYGNNKLSQNEVTAIINEYIRINKLLHPEKKKRVVCDERLHSLFGRKSVARIKIYDLLDAHFAENHDESEDELFFSSEEEENMECKKQKASSSDKKTPHQKKQVPETPKSCFAAMVSENIKLVYLKRSLVQDFLKDPESFEGKVVGSYVRIKSDPNDFFQKNSHQLLLVTGVTKVSGCGGVGADILLQVPNLLKDIHISMLSDDNFSEEECEDLHLRVKDGLLKRPTVVEVQHKAQILHEDITKHWLVREIAMLQNLIDRANEKGWRRELFEYMERKQLLQTPSEQSRLLLEVPKVIADELEPEAIPHDPAESVKQGTGSSPNSILRVASDISIDLEANQTLSTLNSGSIDATGSGDAVIPSQFALVGGESNIDFVNGITSIKVPVGIQVAFEYESYKQEKKMEDQPGDFVQQQESHFIVTRNESGGEMRLVNSGENKGSQGMANKQVTASQVIELSDDDEVDENQGGRDQIVDHPASYIWHYLDPQGVIQGPFSMTALKRWSDADYFQPGFKVWKTGQSQDQAVLLRDVLRRMFHN